MKVEDILNCGFHIACTMFVNHVKNFRVSKQGFFLLLGNSHIFKRIVGFDFLKNLKRTNLIFDLFFQNLIP
jgi:hypothetical protein